MILTRAKGRGQRAKAREEVEGQRKEKGRYIVSL